MPLGTGGPAVKSGWFVSTERLGAFAVEAIAPRRGPLTVFRSDLVSANRLLKIQLLEKLGLVYDIHTVKP